MNLGYKWQRAKCMASMVSFSRSRSAFKKPCRGYNPLQDNGLISPFYPLIW